MKTFLTIVIAVLVVFPAFTRGQDEILWKGLTFDKTTLEDAIGAVGKPKKRHIDKIKTLDFPGGKVVGKQEIQILEFEKINGWEKVSLSFFKDKLFKAKFWPRNKTMRASELTTAYQADFIFAEGFAKGVSLSVFEGQKEPSVPRVYPTVYFMVSAKPDRYLLASINNGSFAAFWKELGREATAQMFPGFVEDITIISRVGEPK